MKKVDRLPIGGWLYRDWNRFMCDYALDIINGGY